MAVAGAADTEPVEDVEEIVVTGTRTPHRQGDAPVAVEVIDREAIERSGAMDVAELLEQHPGVDVTRGFVGAGVRLRGLEADHTLILVDGQRVVGRKDGTYDLSRVPLESIERIEIVKGASSALYGSDALGGVIQIVTRKADDPVEASLTTRAGAPTSADVGVGLGVSGRAASLRLDGGWHGNQPWDADPSTPATTGNGLRQGDLSARVDTRLSDDVAVWLRGAWTGTDARGIDAANGGAILDRRNLTEDGLATFGVDATPDQVSRWSTTLGLSTFRDQYLVDQRDAAPLDVFEETREVLGQLTSQVTRVFRGHTATVGVEAFTSAIQASARLAEDGTRQRAALFAQDEWTVGGSPRVVLVPGLRGDLDTWFGGALAPSATLRVDPVRSVVVRASAGRGWRAPSFRELLLSFDNSAAGYLVQGNPDLRPEQSLSLSASAEWAPSDAVSVALQGHRDRLTDLIQIGTVSEAEGVTRFGYVNVAEAISQGVEASVGLSPTRRVGLDLSGTFLDARDLTAAQPLEGRARLRATAGLHYDVGEAGPRLTTRGVWVGPRPFGDELAPPYALLDARVGQPIGERLQLFAGGENLLDAGDPDFLPTPPRLLYAGVDARM